MKHGRVLTKEELDYIRFHYPSGLVNVDLLMGYFWCPKCGGLLARGCPTTLNMLCWNCVKEVIPDLTKEGLYCNYWSRTSEPREWDYTKALGAEDFRERSLFIMLRHFLMREKPHFMQKWWTCPRPNWLLVLGYGEMLQN